MTHIPEQRSMYEQGYDDGFRDAGHKHLADAPEHPDDPEYMEGYDDGWADGEVEAIAEADEEYDDDDC